jgi:hypothetical protein
MTDRPALQIKSLAEDSRPAQLGTRITCVPATEMLASSAFDREGKSAPSSSPQE